VKWRQQKLFRGREDRRLKRGEGGRTRRALERVCDLWSTKPAVLSHTLGHKYCRTSKRPTGEQRSSSCMWNRNHLTLTQTYGRTDGRGHKQTEIHTRTHKHGHEQTDTRGHRQTVGHTNTDTDRRTDTRGHKQTDGHTNTNTDRRTDTRLHTDNFGFEPQNNQNLLRTPGQEDIITFRTKRTHEPRLTSSSSS